MLLHHDYAASAASVLPRLALGHPAATTVSVSDWKLPSSVTAQNIPCGTGLGAVDVVGHTFSKSRAYAPPGQNFVGFAEASDSHISGRLYGINPG